VRGQGLSTSGAALESLTIEAMLPNSVAVVIECLTDQRVRALQDLRHIIKESGGTVTPTKYLFERKGKIVFEKKEGLSLDDYLETAIDAGATDIEADEDGRMVVFTEHTETKQVAEALSGATDLTIEISGVVLVPNGDTMVTIDCDETAAQLEEVLQSIREEPSVQEIYINYTRS
jgi:transcriptional/translational regulatory protein YebC/TACO1